MMMLQRTLSNERSGELQERAAKQTSEVLSASRVVSGCCRARFMLSDNAFQLQPYLLSTLRFLPSPKGCSGHACLWPDDSDA